MRSLIVILLTLSCLCPAGAATLKLSTWNLEWLTARPHGDRTLPDDAWPKTQEAIDRLNAYARRLDADVIAFQEVDGAAMAAKVFPPDRYQIVIDDGVEVQRVGFAIRRGIHFTQNPDLAALGLGHRGLRGGVDVSLDVDGHPLRLLAVHLKSGCAGGYARRKAQREACEQILQQLPVLQSWVAARAQSGEAYALAGDFNRRDEDNDPFWNGLKASAPLTITDQGTDSPCWGGEEFIDHVVLGGAAQRWLIPGSFKVLVYDETDRAQKEILSDHCPVSVGLDVP